ncbi:hypothetical protein JIN85_09270 [Luteolibacter pohnpeiensis]|uniref:Uncharacterized protein n=1 Tax=Luteolibacter pohnpeiensis TaxID=454153 RepID=A0A934VVV1_9BACT|nr:hypothetical protein [Luteolibacter pohnpeiensis]MBK1882605.1 hypothetical protein [Luteolibacter pohnpeiensis]
MKKLPHSAYLSTGLIAIGGVMYAYAGRVLVMNSDLRVPLNVLGINRSPYGEVIAMAMQSPINQYWNRGLEVQGPNKAPSPAQTSQDTSSASSGGISTFLNQLSLAHDTRTNPIPPSATQRRYLRQEIEDKLKFAYELDPSHYANYNSYHFFLTEPELGTRPELTPGAAKLAENTIKYCLSKKHDPRPSLTAAAATENVLELMFNDQHHATPKYTTAQMRKHLELLDYCIQRYHHLSAEWQADGNWELISPYRRAECEERLQFVMGVRDAAAATITRLEKLHQTKSLTPLLQGS